MLCFKYCRNSCCNFVQVWVLDPEADELDDPGVCYRVEDIENEEYYIASTGMRQPGWGVPRRLAVTNWSILLEQSSWKAVGLYNLGVDCTREKRELCGSKTSKTVCIYVSIVMKEYRG